MKCSVITYVTETSLILSSLCCYLYTIILEKKDSKHFVERQVQNMIKITKLWHILTLIIIIRYRRASIIHKTDRKCL
jgi:hypothetical protein